MLEKPVASAKCGEILRHGPRQIRQAVYPCQLSFCALLRHFINGALQTFSTYAQEVEAARWVGIASAIFEIPSLLNNRYWLGYRQLAALAAFDYKMPGLIFAIENLAPRGGEGA
ncbi:MAG: hypothetical protein RXQ02_05240 [Thermoproteus sp.]